MIGSRQLPDKVSGVRLGHLWAAMLLALLAGCAAAPAPAPERVGEAVASEPEAPGAWAIDCTIVVHEFSDDAGPGSPLADAPVHWYLYTRPLPNRDSPWELEGRGRTDEQGKCLLRIPRAEAEFSVFAFVEGRWRFLDAWGTTGNEASDVPGGIFRADYKVVRNGEYCMAVVVLDAETEEPVEGAEVSRVIQWGGSPPGVWESKTTGPDGRVSFDGLGRQEWHGQVDIRHPGYVPHRGFAHFSRADQRVHYSYYLSKGQAVPGRVIDAEGRPVPGAHVTLEHRCPGYSKWWYRTDAEGRFTPMILPGEEVEIRVEKEGYFLTWWRLWPKDSLVLKLRTGTGDDWVEEE